MKVHVEGRKDPLLNMVSNDFLGLSGNSSIEVGPAFQFSCIHIVQG